MLNKWFDDHKNKFRPKGMKNDNFGVFITFFIKFQIDNVFSCFVQFMILAINYCVVIQLHIGVTCSTLSHCILVNNL